MLSSKLRAGAAAAVMAAVLALAPAAARAQSAFSHQIPIKLPKGANGMQPDLALVYGPSSANGHLGVGWQLSGLSFITRVSYGDGVRFSGNDTYAHSQFGVLVAQADGSYRSKTESFVKFVPSGRCGDGPCAWTLYHPSGGTSYFGTSSNSRVRTAFIGIRTWGLDRVQDVFSNSYEVSYDEDPAHAADAQLYPTVITYTKAPNVSTYRTVTFSYEGRLDTEAGYPHAAGVFSQTSLRLKTITVRTGVTGSRPSGDLLRSYRLDYEYSGGPLNAWSGITGRSRLKQVYELGSDGTSALPPQTFSYQTDLIAYAAPPAFAPPNRFLQTFSGWDGNVPSAWDGGMRLADLDGDGRPDMVHAFYNCGTHFRTAWLNTGAGWSESVAYAPPPPPPGMPIPVFAWRDDANPWGRDGGLRLADLNGDGRPDLIFSSATSLWSANNTEYRYAWINNGNRSCSTAGCAWTPAPEYAPPPGYDFVFSSFPDSGLRLADLNGDGLPDLVRAFSYPALGYVSQGVRLNTGVGWEAGDSAEFAFPGKHLVFTAWDLNGNASPVGLQLVDLDADGRQDLVFAHNGAAGWGAWRNNGHGWTSTPALTPPAAFAGDGPATHCASPGLADVGTRFADLNGDGKPDLVSAWREKSCVLIENRQIVQYPSELHSGAWINTGTTWIPAPAFAPPVAIVDDIVDTGVRIADVNGDGKADLVQGLLRDGTLSRGAWLSTGSDWRAIPEYGPPVPFRTVDGATPAGRDMGLQMVDLLGRGTVDYLQALYLPGNPQLRVWVRSGSGAVVDNYQAPDLMRGLYNGTGGSIDVTYRSAAQVGAIAKTSPRPGIPNAAPRQLVTRITTSDGRGGTYSTRYGYGEFRIVPGRVQDQRDLGLGWMSVADEQTGQSTVTQYDQIPGCEGHVLQVDAYGGTGLRMSRKQYVNRVTAPPADVSVGTELCVEDRQSAWSYEKGVIGTSQTTETLYDAYLNPRAKIQSAQGLPTVTVETTFANDVSSWRFGRVDAIRTTSGGVTLGQMQNVWTGGLLTEKRDWLDVPSPTWIARKMAYDPNGNVACVVASPGGDLNATTVAYRPATGTCSVSSAPPDVQTTATQYDVTYHAYPARVTNALGHVSRSSYNGDGLLSSVTDVNDRTTTTDYDVFGRKWHDYRPDGGTTTYSYVNYGNASGHPNGQYMGVVTTLDTGRTAFTKEYFDGAGFKFQTVTTGDCPTGVFTEVLRDAAGRAWKTSLPHCEGAAAYWTETTYDAYGRVEKVTTPAVTTAAGKQVAGISTTTSEYATDHKTEIDANGQRTTRYHDARDRLTSVVDPAGKTTAYGTDALGRLTRVTLPDGEVTTQTWDSLNRKTGISVPLGASRLTTTYGYDRVGNVLTTTAAGSTVSMTYDALNRVLTKQPGRETTVVYSYDETRAANGKGRLTSQSDDAGTTRFGYTVMGQVASTTRTIDGSDFTQSFTYDLAGRVKHVAHPDGSFADYTFAEGGAHATLSFNGTKIATWSGFNAAGRPGSVAYANGVATAYGYDQMNHLTTLVTKQGAAELQDLEYDWYMVDGVPAANTGGLNIAEILDRRANKVLDGVNTDETQRFGYDALYRLTQADGAWGRKAFAYDAVGNMTAMGGLTDRKLGYVGQQVNSVAGFNDELDATWDYQWTVENRLAATWKNGILKARMVYAADGQRVKKVYSPASGPTVTTIYVGNAYERRTYGDGSPQRHTINLYANGQLVASVTTRGNTATAMNGPNQWRSQLARMEMYDGTTVAGAVMKAGHLAAAVASHPVVVRWAPLALFGMLGLFLAALVVRSLGAWRRSAGPRLHLRLAAAPLALALAFAGCTNGPGGPGLRGAPGPLISGDTLSGPAEGRYFYHRNHLGSSSVITNANGPGWTAGPSEPLESTRINYLPYGEISQANSTGGETVTSKFTGQEQDQETGLYYYGARYYDPSIGRFISADSIVPSLTDPQAHNRYGYARDNPIIYTDPTGHSFWSWVGDVFDAIGSAISAAAGALVRAATWVARQYVDAVKFIIKGHVFALQIAKGMLIAASQNPFAALGLILAIAAGPPGWVGLAVAITAQGMAMAAGVTDPTVLALIGAVAGATSIAAMLMSTGQLTLGEMLKAAGAPPWLQIACAIAVSLIVNNQSSDGADGADGAQAAAAEGGQPEIIPAAETDGGLKELNCRDEARRKVMTEMTDKENLKKLRDLSVNRPSLKQPTSFLGLVAGKIVSGLSMAGKLLGIVKPMADDRKELYFRQCMDRQESI